MARVSVVDLRNNLGDWLGRVAYAHERVIIVSRGRPKAALISIEDLERLENLEDAQAAREGLEEYRRGETITLEELEAELLSEAAERAA